MPTMSSAPRSANSVLAKVLSSPPNTRCSSCFRGLPLPLPPLLASPLPLPLARPLPCAMLPSLAPLALALGVALAGRGRRARRPAHTRPMLGPYSDPYSAHTWGGLQRSFSLLLKRLGNLSCQDFPHRQRQTAAQEGRCRPAVGPTALQPRYSLTRPWARKASAAACARLRTGRERRRGAKADPRLWKKKARPGTIFFPGARTA